MSELTTLEGLNIDFAKALKDSGIAVAPVVGGAVLETFKIERLKLDPSRKVRVAFLMNGGLAFKQHYVKNFGNVLCDGGECCKRLKSISDVLKISTNRVSNQILNHREQNTRRILNI